MRRLELIGILSVMMILMSSFVLADLSCTFDQAATTRGTSAGYIRTESQNLSVTISGWGDTDGVQSGNATAGIITVGSGTITGDLIYNSSLGSNNTYINFTVDTTALDDLTGYTFTATIKNESEGTEATCTSGTYYPDNSIPSCTLATPTASNSEYTPKQTYTTITNSNASSGTIKFGNNIPLSMSQGTSESMTFTGTKATVPEGSYDYIVIKTSDGLNESSTVCRLSNIDVDSSATLVQMGAILDVANDVEQQNNSNMTRNLIIIFGVAAFLYLRKKK